ncbi:hypothetical protein [Bdellovibrio sp. HCB337]|uniref:hypothetical protein n=1 Tax=Bdellovibrio sp. HCB337 TaxID=3394358 RepID=UPI0039A4AD92
MTPLWVVIGLILATVSVSTLGAAFSVVGLAALFSGAVVAVMAMAASLELAKFVLAAYLHQRWTQLGTIFKYYLVLAIVILSTITSLGIFGFLSDAYQSATAALETEAVKLESLKTQQNSARAEIARLNKSVEEIPVSRVTKRMELRKEIEPEIATLTKQIESLEQQVTQSNLHTLELKKKVGPLVYIAKVFKMDIDTVVKYLILLLVCVFDPLAICLVIATSGALDTRRPERQQAQEAPAADSSAQNMATHPHGGGDEILQMRFVGDKDTNDVG